MSTMSTEAEVDFDPVEALTIGLAEIEATANEDKQNRKYLRGEHPRLSWVSKIKKVFGETVADQIHQMNYCKKAIESPVAKMEVTGFDDPTATELFEANRLDLSQSDLYRDALAIRHGFIVLAEAEPGSEVPYEIVVQRAEDCHVEPGSLSPLDRKWAVKVTADRDLGDEGGYRAWVWDGTTYWRYVAEVGDPDTKPVPKASAFTEDPEDPTGPHGFDRVPVIPFALGREPESRLTVLRPLQDRIDMLEVMKVVAGLFGANKQRVFFTRQELDDDDTEASPDYALVLDPGNPDDGQASVTEFSHTPLDNYDDAIDKEIDRFYEIANLPKHGRQNPGAADRSGEAAKAENGDFTSMVGGYLKVFGAAWSEVFALLGLDATPVWADVEDRNELTQMQVVKAAVDSGMPLETALVKYAGFTDDDLRDMRAAANEQRAEEARAREAAMLAAEQGRDDDEFFDD